jgi:hypothetical protein
MWMLTFFRHRAGEAAAILIKILAHSTKKSHRPQQTKSPADFSASDFVFDASVDARYASVSAKEVERAQRAPPFAGSHGLPLCLIG